MNSAKAVLLRRLSPVLVVAAISLQAPLLLAQSPSADSPQVNDGPSEVVRMEAFQVSTDIGRYAEDSSSSAIKVPASLKEISGSLQILNLNAIADRKAISLDDVYPYVIGMTRSSTNALGFTIRGFDSLNGAFSQNLEIDGLMGITSSHGAVSTANVERLEILKGPNSVLYGAMRPGGMINVITKSPKQTSQTTVSGIISTFAGNGSKAGDLTSYIGQIDTTGPIDREKHWLYRFVISGQDLRLFRKQDYDRDLYIYPSFTYQWNPHTFFTVRMEAIQEKRRSDDGLLAPFNIVALVAPYNTVYQEPMDVDRDFGEALSTAFQTRLGDWTLRASTRSTWHVDSRRLFTSSGAAIANTTPVLDNATILRRYRRQFNGHRYNYFDVNGYGTVGPENFRNTFIAGIGGGREFTDLLRAAFSGTLQPPISLYHPVLGAAVYPADAATQEPKDTRNSLGEYVSDQITVAKRLHISIGTRHDQTEEHSYDLFQKLYVAQFVSAFVSQAGALFDFTDSLSAYASWSQSFNANAVTAVDAQGHSGFAPEKGKQYEVGLKYATADHRLNTTVAAYQIKKTNVLTTTGVNFPGTGQAIFRFDGEQRSEGVELETEYLPVPYWQVQLGVSLMKAQITQSSNRAIIGDDLVNAPRGSGSIWTRYNVPTGVLKGFGIGSGFIYTGKRWGGDPTTTAYFVIPGYTRIDTALYYQWRYLDFSLNVQNLLDRKFISTASSVGIYPGDPRKLTFSVNARF